MRNYLSFLLYFSKEFDLLLSFFLSAACSLVMIGFLRIIGETEENTPNLYVDLMVFKIYLLSVNTTVPLTESL